jgi:hypothetical protein
MAWIWLTASRNMWPYEIYHYMYIYRMAQKCIRSVLFILHVKVCIYFLGHSVYTVAIDWHFVFLIFSIIIRNKMEYSRLKHFNLVKYLLPYFFMIHFNIVLIWKVNSPKCSVCPFGLPVKVLQAFVISLTRVIIHQLKHTVASYTEHIKSCRICAGVVLTHVCKNM